MEENTKPTEVTTATETVASPVETTSTTTATSAVATSSNKRPYIILAVIALVAIGAAAVLILTNRGTAVNNMPAGTGLNVRDPEAATAKLNLAIPLFLETASDSGSVTNLAKTLESVVGKDVIKAANVRIGLTTNLADQAVNLVLDAKTNQTQTEGNISINGNIESFGGLNVNVDFMGVSPTEAFFKLKGIPADSATLLAQIGLVQDQWFQFPSDLMAQFANIGENATTNTGIESFTELKDKLNGKPLFVNPKAVAGRNVFGHDLDCMSVDMNPEIRNEQGNVSVEICNNDTLLPIYVGMTGELNGESFVLAFELAETADFTLTAPAGAKEATILKDIFESFVGGFTGTGTTDPEDNSMDAMLQYDPNTMTPEEYEQYQDMLELYYQ